MFFFYSTPQELNEEVGLRLTAARIAAGYQKRVEAVRELGWNPNTYKSHEFGVRGIDPLDAYKYARAYGVSVEFLLALDMLNRQKGESKTLTREERDTLLKQSTTRNPFKNFGDQEHKVNTVPLYGQAAGGMWMEGEDLPVNDPSVQISAVAEYPADYQYARKVVGNSVSRHIRDGEYAIFVHYDHFPGRLEFGDLVDCKRERAGLVEHSVKAYFGDKLMTDSDELETQIAIPLDHTDEDTTVSIVGVAVGTYRPLIRKRYKTNQFT